MNFYSIPFSAQSWSNIFYWFLSWLDKCCHLCSDV